MTFAKLSNKSSAKQSHLVQLFLSVIWIFYCGQKLSKRAIKLAKTLQLSDFLKKDFKNLHAKGFFKLFLEVIIFIPLNIGIYYNSKNLNILSTIDSLAKLPIWPLKLLLKSFN